MAELVSISDIINRATGGAGAFENLFFFKDARIAAAAAVTTTIGFWNSLWQYNGHPAGGAVPTTAAVPTRATTGSLFQANPGGGRQKWITGIAGTCATYGTLVLYDRLLHNGGLSGTVITAQTVGGTLTRYTNGDGNQIWLEIYTQIGNTQTTVTASYTNQAGVAGRTTTARLIGGASYREAQRVLQLPLQAGDTGVQSVESVTLAATTGTAGDFGVVIAHPLITAAFDEVGVGALRDTISAVPGPVEIVTDACLSMFWQAAVSSGSINLFASLHSVEA
jgi:hypothetical protein